MEEKTKKILKAIAIFVAVPTVIAVGYYSVVFIDRRMKNKKAITIISEGIDKSAEEHKENQPAEMKSVIISGWEEEFKKLSDSAFNAFYNYLKLTFPYGKNKESNYWAYEDIDSDEFAKRKDALEPHYKELNKDTKIMEYFQQMEKKF